MVIARPSDRQRSSASPSSGPPSGAPVDDAVIAIGARARVRSVAGVGTARSTSTTRTSPPADSSRPCSDPAQSTATPSVVPEVGTTARSRSAPSSTTLARASSSSRPARRARSEATTGPRKGVSAATRPSSRAMIATSTPDANGPSSSPGPRSSNQPDRSRGVGEPPAPDGVVEIRRPCAARDRRRARRCSVAARAAPGSSGCPRPIPSVPGARRHGRAATSFSTLPAAFTGRLSTISTSRGTL